MPQEANRATPFSFFAKSRTVQAGSRLGPSRGRALFYKTLSFAGAHVLRLCVLSLTALVFFCASSQAGTVTLKFGHTFEPNTPLGFGAEKLAELAYKYSRGELIIKVFHAGQAGSQPELTDKLSCGVMDMAMTSMEFLAQQIPELLVFELPFIFRNNDHAYAALDGVGLEATKAGEFMGFKTLAMMERAQLHLCSGKTPFKNPKDLRGSYMRIGENPGSSKMMLFYMGARPVRVLGKDLPRAVSRGDVEGMECTPAQVWRGSAPSIQKYLSLTAHRYFAAPVLVSMARWKRLSPPQREALALAARDAAEWQRALCRKQNTDYLHKIHAKRMAEVFFTLDRRPFEEAALPVWKLFASEHENGQALIDKIRDIP